MKCLLKRQRICEQMIKVQVWNCQRFVITIEAWYMVHWYMVHWYMIVLSLGITDR